MKKLVLMLNMSETSTDPRVRRISRTLAANGYEVIGLSPAYDVEAPRSVVDNFEVRRFRGPPEVTARAMRQRLDRLPDCAAMLQRIQPALFRDAEGLRDSVRWRVHRTSRRAVRVIEKLGRAPRPRLMSWVRKLENEREAELRKVRSVMLANLAMFEAGRSQKADVVHVNDLNALLAGVLLKKHHGARLVYDAHEIYPEQFAVSERSELWHSFYTQLEETLIREADGRLTVCDSLGDYFVRRYSSGPFQTILNVPSIRFLPDASILSRKSSPRVLLYHGMFFKNRGLENLIEAGRYLRGARIVLRGLGYHRAELVRRAEDPALRERVSIVPPVAVDELVRTASEVDVGLNPFPSACLNTEFALPNKHFEYMMAGLSVASSDLIELRRLTTKLDNGVLFRSIDPRDLADSLNELVQKPDLLDAQRERSYAAARSEYHWEYEELRLLEYYRRIA